MKLANIDGVIWLIIFVMVAIGKGWSKLQESNKDDSSSADDAAPVVRPRPRIPPPQPQPHPAVAPMARPTPKVVPRVATVPRTSAPTPRGRNVGADDIRRFVDQLSGKPQPSPAAPVAPPPVRKTAAVPPPALQPEPVAQVTEAKQSVASAPVPVQASRASQWMEALRDRNNIRNIIISAEIIGLPKSESM